MDPVKKILGNDSQCYVCGKMGQTKSHLLYLTDYGVRTRQTRELCASCRKASDEGNL